MRRRGEEERIVRKGLLPLIVLSLVMTLPGRAADPILLQGHQEVVYDSVFLPDGKSVVTASFDRTLKLWDLTTKQSVRTMEGHTGIILTVDVSPDGTLIASAGSDNTIKLWDVPKNDPVQTLAAHDAAGTAIAVSFDGLWLASGDQSGVLRIWNAESSEKTQEIKLPAAVTRLSWKRDAKQLVAISGTAMHVLDPADGSTMAVVGVHSAEVTGLVFSPNNSQIWTSGADGFVKRWPVTYPASVTATGHTGAVNAFSQSANRTMIATAGQDGTARIFNRADGKELVKLEGHTGPVTAVRFSPNGAQVATGSADKTVRLFDTAGKLVKDFPGAAGSIVAVAFSANAQQLFVADQTGQIRILKADDAAEEKKIAFGSAIRTAAFTNNGSLFAAAGQKTVRLWTVNDGKEIKKLDLDVEVSSLEFSGNNTTLAVGLTDGSIRLLNPTEGVETARLTGHGKAITELSFNLQGTQLVSSSEDGSARLWDLAKNTELEHFPGHTGAVTGMQFQIDNRYVVSSGADGSLRVSPVTADLAFVADEKRVNGLAVSSNGAVVATAGQDGSVKTWNSNGGPTRSFTGFEGPALSVALSANNTQVAAAGKDGTVRTWNVSNGQAYFKFQAAAEPVQVEFSPDSTKLVVSLADQKLQCFDPTPLNPVPAEPPSRDASQTLSGHTAAISGLAWAPDNLTLRTIGADKTVRAWSVAAAGATSSLTGHSSQIYSVAFNYDGTLLATGSNDKTIRLWDVAARKALKNLPTQQAAVYGVAFSPDGKFLATAGADHTVRLFDVEKGNEVRKFTGPEHPVYCIAMNKDGSKISAAGMGIGDSRNVFVWNIDNPEPAHTLKGHPDDIYRVQFSQSSERVLSLGYAGNLRVWDTAGGKAVFEQAVGAVSYSARFSPDGKSVVVSSNDRTARILELPAAAQ